VNAVANIGTNQLGFLAAMGMPAANGNVQGPAVPVFDHMMGLFLSPNSLSSDQAPAAVSAPLATASQIADAMIRSMLGTPAAATTTTTTTTTTTDATSLVVPEVVAAVVAKAVPNLPGPATKDQTPPKESRSILDLATVTSVVVTPVPISALPGPVLTAAPAPETASVLEKSTDLPAQAAPAMALFKSLPEAKVAFTAVLTPADPTVTPEGSKPIAVAMEPAAVPSIPIVSAPPQNTTEPAPTLDPTPSIAVQASGEKAGGETNSQQESSKQGEDLQPPAQPIVTAANSRIKAPTPKQDAGEAAPATAREVATVIVPTSIVPVVEHAAVATPVNAGAALASPFNSTANALRASESNLPAAPQLRTGIAQEISIRIAPPDSPAVDLRVVERAGQVHVDVRTSDAAMQTSLRQDLGTLTNSLQRAGYHAETFTPSGTGRAAASAQTTNQDRQDPSQNRNGSGDPNGGRRQPQQKRSGTWLEELEEQS
jgi:hypothetical protein